MKITKELKDIISRQIAKKREEERNAIMDAHKELADKVNAELLECEEFENLKLAAERWEAKLDSIIDSSNGALLRSFCGGGSYYRSASSWDMRSHLEASKLSAIAPSGVFNQSTYENLQDAIILRLSYGADFEEAKKILAEYGISLDMQ